jgi:bacterioferritin
MGSENNTEILKVMNQIYEQEVSGIIRYMHYSFMIMGHHRIPIQKWLREQSAESMDHAVLIGEKITSLGGHPKMAAAAIDESGNHSVNQILQESLKFEEETLNLYKKLVKLAGEDIALEELARTMVRQETEHLEEVRKMVRHE